MDPHFLVPLLRCASLFVFPFFPKNKKKSVKKKKRRRKQARRSIFVPNRLDLVSYGAEVDPSMAGALQYLESQRNAQPDLAEWYSSLADLYQRKLWHQLTLKLEQFVALAVVQVRSLSLTSCCLFFLGFMDYSLVAFVVLSSKVHGKPSKA